RAGAEGSALSFIGNEDQAKWNAIQRLIDPNFRAELGRDSRRRRKRGGHSFDRRDRRNKNRFTHKRRDKQSRQNENQSEKNSRSFKFKKRFNKKKKGL
ncbi:MAG: ATP-dependent helicase, partial [Candidatus Pelagibacter sp. TMED253]